VVLSQKDLAFIVATWIFPLTAGPKFRLIFPAYYFNGGTERGIGSNFLL